MTVAVNDVVRLALTWTFLGADQFTNVWHTVIQAVPGGLFDNDDYMDAMSDAFEVIYADIIPYMSTALEVLSLEGQVVATGELLPARTPDIDGTSGGSVLPTQTSAMVYFPTTQSRVRGSVFLPPFGEGEITNSEWEVGVLADLATFGALATALVTQDGFSFFRVAYNYINEAWHRPSGFVVPSRPRTQRRRRVGVGS